MVAKQSKQWQWMAIPKQYSGQTRKITSSPPHTREHEKLHFGKNLFAENLRMGLLQFALTQFGPFYLVIKSGNFGRFIGR